MVGLQYSCIRKNYLNSAKESPLVGVYSWEVVPAMVQPLLFLLPPYPTARMQADPAYFTSSICP